MNTKEEREIPYHTILIIVVQLVGVVVWTLGMKSDIERNADSVARVEIKIEKMEETWTESQKRLVTMEKDISNILLLLTISLDIPTELLEKANLKTSSIY